MFCTHNGRLSVIWPQKRAIPPLAAAAAAKMENEKSLSVNQIYHNFVGFDKDFSDYILMINQTHWQLQRCIVSIFYAPFYVWNKRMTERKTHTYKNTPKSNKCHGLSRAETITCIIKVSFIVHANVAILPLPRWFASRRYMFFFSSFDHWLWSRVCMQKPTRTSWLKPKQVSWYRFHYIAKHLQMDFAWKRCKQDEKTRCIILHKI